jgi:hypothetical protein
VRGEERDDGGEGDVECEGRSFVDERGVVVLCGVGEDLGGVFWEKIPKTESLTTKGEARLGDGDKRHLICKRQTSIAENT